MSFAFPTLDSLRNELPKADSREAMAEWVGLLGAAPSSPVAKATGWTPPPLSSKVEETVDLEALQTAAREEGFRRGYADGKAAGNERGLAEGRRQGRDEARTMVLEAENAILQDFRAELEVAAAGVGPAVERWRESIEERATELAMNAVRALLAAELSVQRPDAMGIVREALGFAEGAVRATVRLSPFDRAALVERREEILAACAGLRDVDLVDDRSIEGGCIIETENGVVDATLATRLALLEAA